ncbi:hypothetical protein EVA_17862 [gut metagenome]|uniref:Uncharacterized protein n=1 Tax=gut metagenome TaxID=749906 RepID=J9FWV3_9ZZZZ
MKTLNNRPWLQNNLWLFPPRAYPWQFPKRYRKLCNICHFIQTKFNSRAFSWNWFWQGDSVYPIQFEAPDCNGLNYIFFSCKVMAIVRNL